MQDEHFSPQESLQVIQSMIGKAKEDLRGNDIYFLMWGWITFVACTSQFLLKKVFDYPYHYRVWWLTLLGILLSILFTLKKSKTKSTETYIGESMSYLWTGMGISFFVLSMILSRIGWDHPVFPFFIMLYGLGTFISGCLLRFRPFIIGGIAAWVIAVISVWLEYDFQILAGGVAILVSYIIPAYLLRLKIKKTQTYER